MVARLTFELVPATCWWSNVRSQVTKAQWEACKNFVKVRSGSRCEICGGVGKKWPVEAHEIWDYNDDEQIQTLVGLIALCPTCHRVKHIGRTMETSSIGEVDRVLAHVQRVNGWSLETTHKAVRNTFAIWQIRSSWEWDLDVSWLVSIGIRLPKYVWTREERVTDASRAGD